MISKTPHQKETEPLGENFRALKGVATPTQMENRKPIICSIAYNH